MQVAYLLYDRFTALDITGPHDVLNSLPDVEPVFVAEQAGPVRNESDTLSLVADASIDEVTEPDVVVIPGGFGNRAPVRARAPARLARTVHERTEWTTSVCTGSLLLAAAGLLDGAAGHHPLARARPAGRARRRAGPRPGRPSRARSSPPPASRRASTWPCAWSRRSTATRRPGGPARHRVRPEPPFDTGSPEKAPKEIVDRSRRLPGAGARTTPSSTAAQRHGPRRSLSPPSTLIVGARSHGSDNGRGRGDPNALRPCPRSCTRSAGDRWSPGRSSPPARRGPSASA